jgi:hypothetical protein
MSAGMRLVASSIVHPSAADLYTKIRAHVAKAPVSRPIRLVV